MLIGLSIQDLVLIERLTLSFETGLSALTGETGAGKSILLDALGLALGMRGDAGLIRVGAQQAVVAAEFIVPEEHPIQVLLQEQGFDKNQTLVFRRIIAANGRSRAFINDQMVSVGFLRQLGDQLLEIHGQFDRLLDGSAHRQLLDDFAQVDALVVAVNEAYHEWKDSDKKWEEAHQRLETLKREEGYLRFQLEELGKLNLKENEEEILLEQRNALSSTSRLCDGVQTSWKNLGGPSVLDALQGGLRALTRIQDLNHSKIEAAAIGLRKAIEEATESISLLEEVQQDLEDAPQRLQTIDDRLHTLRAAARKHAVAVADLPTYVDRLKTDLDLLDHSEDATAQLALNNQKLRQHYYEKAMALMGRRCQVGKLLDEAVMRELPDLKLPHAQFQTLVEEVPESQWNSQGIDRIDFQVAMNKGQALCSLTKAASGGELARLMLALKAVLAAKSNLSTIIFDEIDIGVGGAVAAAIGKRLQAMSAHVQVMAITHSPQVAACASHHYYVSKAEYEGEMRTQVTVLEKTMRQEELARMLSGAEITSEARAAAGSLLQQYG